MSQTCPKSDVNSVQGRTWFNRPGNIFRKMPPPELRCAGYRLRIIIQEWTEAPRRRAARLNRPLPIRVRLRLLVCDLQHGLQRGRHLTTFLGQRFQEPRPVLAKSKRSPVATSTAC